MSVPFNWEKHEVTGVGHNAQLMANDALQYLLPFLLSNNGFELNEQIKLYPNLSNEFIYFNNEKIKSNEASIYSINGNIVSTLNFTSFKNQQGIDISQLNSGVYF